MAILLESIEEISCEMELILLAITGGELIVAVLALTIGVFLIKRHDKKRHHYFLYKKRIRILREFKEIYYSYHIYRLSISKGIDDLLNDEQIKKLIRNKFFDSNGDMFDCLNQNEKYLNFKERINKLDLLSDDFEILFEKNQAATIQSFIFWYRTLILGIASYKMQHTEDKEDYSTHTILINSKLKKLEESFKKLNESLVFVELGRQANLAA